MLARTETCCVRSTSQRNAAQTPSNSGNTATVQYTAPRCIQHDGRKTIDAVGKVQFGRGCVACMQQLLYPTTLMVPGSTLQASQRSAKIGNSVPVSRTPKSALFCHQIALLFVALFDCLLWSVIFSLRNKRCGAYGRTEPGRVLVSVKLCLPHCDSFFFSVVVECLKWPPLFSGFPLRLSNGPVHGLQIAQRC